MAGYFQLFAEPYVMTRGDPLQSTYSVLYYMYEEGFMWWSLGRASAIAFCKLSAAFFAESIVESVFSITPSSFFEDCASAPVA